MTEAESGAEDEAVNEMTARTDLVFDAAGKDNAKCKVERQECGLRGNGGCCPGYYCRRRFFPFGLCHPGVKPHGPHPPSDKVKYNSNAKVVDEMVTGSTDIESKTDARPDREPGSCLRRDETCLASGHTSDSCCSGLQCVRNKNWFIRGGTCVPFVTSRSEERVQPESLLDIESESSVDKEAVQSVRGLETREREHKCHEDGAPCTSYFDSNFDDHILCMAPIQGEDKSILVCQQFPRKVLPSKTVCRANGQKCIGRRDSTRELVCVEKRQAFEGVCEWRQVDTRSVTRSVKVEVDRAAGESEIDETARVTSCQRAGQRCKDSGADNAHLQLKCLKLGDRPFGVCRPDMQLPPPGTSEHTSVKETGGFDPRLLCDGTPTDAWRCHRHGVPSTFVSAIISTPSPTSPPVAVRRPCEAPGDECTIGDDHGPLICQLEGPRTGICWPRPPALPQPPAEQGESRIAKRSSSEDEDEDTVCRFPGGRCQGAHDSSEGLLCKLRESDVVGVCEKDPKAPKTHRKCQLTPVPCHKTMKASKDILCRLKEPETEDCQGGIVEEPAESKTKCKVPGTFCGGEEDSSPGLLCNLSEPHAGICTVIIADPPHTNTQLQSRFDRNDTEGLLSREEPKECRRIGYSCTSDENFKHNCCENMHCIRTGTETTYAFKGICNYFFRTPDPPRI